MPCTSTNKTNINVHCSCHCTLVASVHASASKKNLWKIMTLFLSCCRGFRASIQDFPQGSPTNTRIWGFQRFFMIGRCWALPFPWERASREATGPRPALRHARETKTRRSETSWSRAERTSCESGPEGSAATRNTATKQQHKSSSFVKMWLTCSSAFCVLKPQCSSSRKSTVACCIRENFVQNLNVRACLSLCDVPLGKST